jgi:hypothetical protein
VTLALKAHAKACLKPLKHEFEPQEGWSELLSLASTNKGWIHRYIDGHHYLSRLFRKVLKTPVFTTEYGNFARPELKTLSQASSTIQREASGLQSRPLSTQPFASWFSPQYLHCPSLPARSGSFFFCWHVSYLCRSFHPYYRIMRKKAVWQLWQGEFWASLFPKRESKSSRYTAILVVFLSNNA